MTGYNHCCNDSMRRCWPGEYQQAWATYTNKKGAGRSAFGQFQAAGAASMARSNVECTRMHATGRYRHMGRLVERRWQGNAGRGHPSRPSCSSKRSSCIAPPFRASPACQPQPRRPPTTTSGLRGGLDQALRPTGHLADHRGQHEPRSRPPQLPVGLHAARMAVAEPTASTANGAVSSSGPSVVARCLVQR